MSQNLPTESKSQTSSTVAPALKSDTSQAKHFISIAALVVMISFFLPWTSFLGAGISGLDVQKSGDQFYRFVWFMPLLAFVTLTLNLIGKGSNLVRRLAGIFPFVILLYSSKDLGVDVFKLLAYGAWLGLLGAAILVCIPTGRVPNPAA